MRRIIAALTALTGISAGPFAAAQTITWLTTDLPPQYISEGELAGQGIKDQQLRLIAQQVPEFQHHTMRASISRLWYQMQHEDGFCGIGVLRRPEREKIAVFSRRSVLVPGFRLVVRPDDAAPFEPFLSEAREVDLGALTQSPKLKGSYVADRVYPPAVATYIDSDQRRLPIEKSVDGERLFQLLRTKRVDFVFGLAYEATYYAWKIGMREPLPPLPIKDTPRTVAGYTACSNGPVGRAMIARLDALQRDPAFWQQWLEPLKRWVAPADFNVALAAVPVE